MASHRLKWTLTQGQTGATLGVGDQHLLNDTSAWHVFISGTIGTVTGIQIEYSPDTPEVPDNSSRWFAPSALLFTTLGDTYFGAKFRKVRVILTGGDGTTSLTVEIR